MDSQNSKPEGAARPRLRLLLLILGLPCLALSSLLLPVVRGQVLLAAFAFDDPGLRAWAVARLAELGPHGIEGLTLAIADQAARREAKASEPWSRAAGGSLSPDEDQILANAARALAGHREGAAPAIPYLLRCTDGVLISKRSGDGRLVDPVEAAIAKICERDPGPLVKIALDRKEELALRSLALSALKSLRNTRPELALLMLPALQDARFHIRNEALDLIVRTEPPPGAALPAIFRMRSFPAATEPYHIVRHGDLTVFQTAAYRLGPELLPELLRLSGDLEFRRDAAAVLDAHERDHPERTRRYLTEALNNALDAKVAGRAAERLERMGAPR